MIWPFKRTPRQTREEYAAAQPPAPCGQQQVHHLWLLDGMPCPACTAAKSLKRKDAELDALADKIVARLREHGSGVQASAPTQPCDFPYCAVHHICTQPCERNAGVQEVPRG